MSIHQMSWSLHRRIAACLINVIGEEHFQGARTTVKVSIQTEQISQTTIGDVVEELEKPSKVCGKLTKGKGLKNSRGRKVIINSLW